jgi:hypothetical protein
MPIPISATFDSRINKEITHRLLALKLLFPVKEFKAAQLPIFEINMTHRLKPMGENRKKKRSHP